MLRKLPILFLGLTFSIVGFAAQTSSSLHLKPESSSKIIGAIRNTEIMVLLENQGDWSKVIDVETGMVGWLLHAPVPPLQEATPQTQELSSSS